MPGTLLLDDWRQAVEDQLTQHARQAFQVVGNPPPAPDPQQILNELQSHAAQAAQQAQQGVAQFAQQRQQDAAAVGQQLQDYAQQASQGINQFNQPPLAGGPSQPPASTVVSGVTPFEQPPPQPAPIAAPAATPQAGGTSGGMPNVQIDASSPEAFIRSVTPAAQWVQAKTGIPAEAMIGMAANETGYGKAAPGNNLFGIKGSGPAGATTSPTWEDYGNGPVQITDKFRRYNNATESFQDFVQFLRDNPRYHAVMNLVDQGQANVGSFVQGLKDAGYMTDPNYVGKIENIVGRYQPLIDQAKQTVGGAIAQGAGAVQQGFRDISQFGDAQLTNSEAYAACGPAAAVRFAERFGRNPTLREAVDLAKQVGWTEASGMAGIGSEQRLLEKLGVPTSIVQGAQWDRFAKEAQTGNPVTISTPGHYFYADGYDPSSGAFHVGRSGTDLRGGKEWMTPADMESRMGAVQGALLADNPTVPSKSSSPTYDVGGTRPAPRAPIYAGVMQPAGGNEPAPFQVIGDTVGPVVQDIKQAAGQAGEAVGGALGAAGEAIGGALGSAGQAIGGAISDVGSGAQQTLSDVGQSGLANQVLRSGRTEAEREEFRQRQQEELQRVLDEQRRRDLEPITAQSVATGTWGTIINANPAMGITLDDYLKAQNSKNQWIEQNNPLRDVPVAGGLLTGIAQQLTDPLQVVTFGPTVGLGRAVGAAAGEQAAGVAGRMLSPAATRMVASVADKFSSGAIVGGLQNALFEAEQPDATPESVGKALLVGAGLGGVIDAAAPAVGRIGRSIIDRAPDLRDVAPEAILRARQRGEVNIDAALGGVPGAVERVRGETPTPARVEERLPATPEAMPARVPEATSEPAGKIPATVHPETGLPLNPDGTVTLYHGTTKEGAQQIRATGRLKADAEPDVYLTTDPQGGAYGPGEVGYGDGTVVAVNVDPRRLILDDEFPSGRRDFRINVGRPGGSTPVKLGPDVLAEGGASAQGLPGRQGAQITPPFATNLAGAAVGGYAGNVATPEDAPLDVRLRNIGLGATAGLLGTGAITRTLERRPALAAATTRVAAERAPETGFRAPETPRPGEDLLRATTQEPITGTPREPRSLGEVQSNPHLLREAGPGDTPLTDEQLAGHYDTLEQRMQDVQQRFDAVDEQLRNPNARPERPPWAAGYTNDQLVQIARQHDVSAYEPNWWERAGLETGSGEVRENVGEGRFQRGLGQREPTQADLRAERNQLAKERRDLVAAAQQLGEARPGQRFVQPTERGQVGELPFAGDQEATPHGPYATETAGPSGNLAADIVTKNGTKPVRSQLGPSGLREEPGQVVGTKGGLTGRGILEPETAGEVTARAQKVMPNLDAMVGKDMPEVRAQIQQAVVDNPELFEAYQQGRISHDSLVNDLATKVGMTAKDFLKTPVGKGFNPQEMVALQAAAIDSQHRQTQLAEEIMAKGGVDSLTPEEVAYGLSSLLDAARLLPVATGARSTAGRALNALKIRIDRGMAAGINASNERIAARREADAARRAAVKATRLIEKTRDLEGEQKQALNGARDKGAPKNILDQIAAAYDQLDRYQAMTLHEKGAEFDRLAKERAAAAAKRKEAVRGAPEELLSALKAELKAEQQNFAKRKDTWETMAFWDTKANENAINKRNAFRGGLYLEQQRKSALLAEKTSEARAAKAWDLEQKRQTRQSDKASALLEAIGGEKPSRELLASFVDAITSPDDLAAPKFLKGMQKQGWWGRSQIMRIAGLLSSTATHMINAVGNITQVPLEVVSHAGTIGIDWARAKATGGERQAYWAELGPMLEGYGPGFIAHLPEAIKILQSGITPVERADLSKIRAGFQSGSTKVDTAIEAPLRMLQASDELFRGGAFAMQANRVATRYATQEGFTGARRAGRMRDIVSHLEDYPELYQEAQDAAARMVFQEKRTVPMPQTFTKGVPGEIARAGVSQPLPFVKTPANITAQGFGLSPLGLAGVAEALANRPNVRPERLGRQTLLAEQRLARTALGTMIFGGGVAMGAGVFTGGKSMLTGAYDDKEASTYPQGWREWSMRTEDPVTGNTYYIPIQNFGAAGVPLAMAAIVTDAGHRGKTLLDEDEMKRASTAIGAYVLDNTFLQGLSDTVNVLHDPSRYAPKFVEGLVSSYGPFSSLGRQVQRAMGTASRNPREGLLGLVDALEANYPGLSANVPEATTAIGEPRTQGISGVAAFALPIRADIERDEPTLKLLRENDVSIPPEPKQVNIGRGQSIDLTEAEQDQVKRARGAAIKQAVDQVQQTRAWQGADLATRNALLSQAVNFGTQTANVDFYRALSPADVQSRAKARTVAEPYYIGGAPS